MTLRIRYDQDSLQSNWVKFVALFIILFALFDFCTPESCDAQSLLPAQTILQAQTQSGGEMGETCQFEEDCFNCAHFTPCDAIVLKPIAIVAKADVESYSSTLDGMPAIPYHPPRS